MSYLQGCRVSRGLQGLQGLSSVGLWLLRDKLQGEMCQGGVTGCQWAPRWQRPLWPACGSLEGARGQKQSLGQGLEPGDQGCGAERGQEDGSRAALEDEHEGQQERCRV